MYPPLNLPQFDLKLEGDKIWDVLRKKYLLCTPEEWVRQNFIQYLIQHKNYPQGRMVSEYTVDYNGLKKRCDIAIFNEELGVDVIVECKAPNVALTEDTFYQIAKYTSTLRAPILILTNGLEHYCGFVDLNKKELRFLKEIPDVAALKELLNPS
ncbi:type I restriction enzyme HsdR N-terminal domain-containing protein [Paracrocinitomix mangrovi]|uniref:type I restriction enzyme HsdR N-terminal domain-containing protein n=1 Tax=Paracrocinitomix mangrovi TaxID=2862509 RepID=UPI001C8EA629|nr:type I restriction enzyme HsdR N-terminal domain-containing protein [Paracrocinitomix mangrovi]UKN02880.1 type I restriction enzyme HsdR N-terminal domain-containing protein [Paracrocinitomix mangrovi]